MGFEKIRKSQNSTGYGFVKFTPDISIPAGQKLPLIVFLHGIGAVGDGEGGLDNLLNNEIPGNLKKGVASTTQPFFLLAPQIGSTNYTGAETDAMLDYALANMAVDPDWFNLTGLSLGGGGTFRYISSSAQRAARLSTAIPIATTWISGNYKNVADARLPVWAFHNMQDTNGGTPVAATNAAIDSINSYPGGFKAVKTLFNATGHGGWDTAYGLVPPIAPNGQGLIYPTATIYQWMYMCRRGVPIAVPGSQSVPGLLADAGPDFTSTAQRSILDGSRSQNYKTSSWGIITAPVGVSPYDPSIFPTGAGWHTIDVFFPKPGSYRFRLTVRDNTGATAVDEVDVVYNPSTGTTSTTTTSSSTLSEKIELSRTLVPKIGKHVHVYDNGTIETK